MKIKSKGYFRVAYVSQKSNKLKAKNYIENNNNKKRGYKKKRLIF